MKQFETPWSDTPRWARGIFLANLVYMLYTAFAASLLASTPHHPSWIFVFFLPVAHSIAGLSSSSRVFLYHFLWCLFGALLVQWFGEKKGLLLLVGGHFAASLAVTLYGIAKFSLTH